MQCSVLTVCKRGEAREGGDGDAGHLPVHHGGLREAWGQGVRQGRELGRYFINM